MTITGGTWKIGKVGGCVVTDDMTTVFFTKRDSPDSVKYYGGSLIAESCRDADAKLIAAAPDLLKVCIEVEKHHQGQHSELGFMLREAIKKATE